MIQLSFGTDAKAKITLTSEEARRLRDHLTSRLPAPVPIISDVSKAAMAVDAARLEGKQ